MSIERFEDIVAWQKARLLTREVYRATRSEPCSRDFRYCNQIQSASVSIMSNIAEGYERGTTRQLDHYLSIAKASCAEVRSLLYVGLDVGYMSKSAFNALMRDAEEIGRIIAGFRKSLRTRDSAIHTRNPNTQIKPQQT